MWSPPSSGPAPEQALISLTVLNGLRVCEQLARTLRRRAWDAATGR